MKERLDVLLVKKKSGGFQRKGKGNHYVRDRICRRTERR